MIEALAGGGGPDVGRLDHDGRLVGPVLGPGRGPADLQAAADEDRLAAALGEGAEAAGEAHVHAQFVGVGPAGLDRDLRPVVDRGRDAAAVGFALDLTRFS